MAESSGTPAKKKVKTPPEVCETIYQMGREGMSIGDIAEQTGVRVPVVSGLIQTAKNQGKIPKTPPVSPEVRMSQPGVPPPPPSNATPAPFGTAPTSVDSVRWRSSGPGSALQPPSANLRYAAFHPGGVSTLPSLSREPVRSPIGFRGQSTSPANLPASSRMERMVSSSSPP